MADGELQALVADLQRSGQHGIRNTNVKLGWAVYRFAGISAEIVSSMILAYLNSSFKLKDQLECHTLK